MALKSRINLTTRQALTLSGQMRESLAILRLPTAALLDDIAREAADNPFLVVEGPSGGVSAYDYAIETTAAPESLIDTLTRQLALQRLDPPTLAAATYLVGELREDGYLDTALDEIAAETGAPLDILEGGLHALQRCEPAGIGARDLPECLALQLIDAGIDGALARRATAHLADFAEGRWARLEKLLSLPEARLRQIADLLRRFPSHPIEGDTVAPAILIPEIRIERRGNRVEARLNADAIPRVAVLSADRAALSGGDLRGLYDRAGALAAAIGARLTTLKRIATVIAARQEEFFLGGAAPSLQPLSRAEIAAELDLHPSTVGRALNGKALIADGKVYPFSQFFSRPLPGGAAPTSPFDAQRRIKDLVATEDPGAPLADAEIQSQLKNEGVDIARRTVAKYRKCMRIPSSFARRTRKPLAKDGSQPPSGD